MALALPFRLLLTELLMTDRDDEATDGSRFVLAPGGQDAK